MSGSTRTQSKKSVDSPSSVLQESLFPIETATLSVADAYPGIQNGYPIALASYESNLKRHDAIDARIQFSITVFPGVIVAIFAIAAKAGAVFSSWPLIVAGVFLLAGYLVGLFARDFGKVKLLDPNAFLDPEWLERPDSEFKIGMIQHAAIDFNELQTGLETKWRLLNLMNLLFLLALAAVVAWVVMGVGSSNPVPAPATAVAVVMASVLT